MGKVLRGYQGQLKQGIRDTWARGAKCTIGVTATGSGKTVTMASLAGDLTPELLAQGGYGIIQAHRAELVSQLSLALAEEGIRHNIVGSTKTVKAIVDLHMKKLGRNFVDPRARWIVASVDTLIRRPWPNPEKVLYVFTDEGHHVLQANKWGRAITLFPQARVLLMTATPTRADGKGLGAHHDGLANAMVLGPGLGDLMDNGYLVKYQVASAKAEDLNMEGVEIGASGEYNQKETAKRVKGSRKMIGDAVGKYKELAMGKLAICFAVDIEEAQKITNAFNGAGVPAALVTADTEDAERLSIMDRFRARELRVLVNVDLFGEGVDVPAVEVVMMARPTASFSLYAQMIGRMLRLDIDPALMAQWDTFTPDYRKALIAVSAKPFALLIDLVGNIYNKWKIGDGEYGPMLPEAFADWSLDRRGSRRGKIADGIPQRMCLPGCGFSYERFYDVCPFCGVPAPLPMSRGGPQEVDGAVSLLDAQILAVLRGEAARVNNPVIINTHLPLHAQMAQSNAHYERQAAQGRLLNVIAVWAGHQRKRSQLEKERLFFMSFGVDIASAQALNAAGAAKLQEKIENAISNHA